jgi:DNA mismatch repair protein MutL
MSSKIRVLPDHVINQIAAGEVIANPASVVKELTENALDAGASEIIVEIKAGGRSLIRISDDGCGMNRDDALLCLERYGTSKLRALDDLQSLATMGFRGEAVPSIASISKLTLITSPKEGGEGSMVVVEGGKVLQCSSAVRSVGTTFEVKSLFYNVPVRKKFQKSPAFDSTEILRVVSLLALANPKVKFQLIDDQKEVLTTSVTLNSDPFNNRILDVLGKNFLEALLPVDHTEGGYHIWGKIGIPTFSRQNRSGQYLFINGRAVISQGVSQAVREGYGTSLPSQRHPVYVVNLEMPPALVDVNVHPQKREIRFAEETLIKTIVAKAVLNALQQESQEQILPTVENQTTPFSSSFARDKFSISPTFSLDLSHAEIPSKEEKEVDWILPPPPTVEKQEKEEALLIPKPALSTIRVLATMPGYFFGEKGEQGLFLIDQKRAHHRILFEKFQNLVGKEEKESPSIQYLLIPHTIELTRAESALMREWIPTLNKIGIAIRDFGETTFLIEGLPDSFKHQDISTLLTGILDDLQEFQESQTLKYLQEKQLSQLAARAALSSNTRLSLYEAQNMVDQLMKCLSTQHCPQGKPIMIQIERDSITKILG